MFTKMVFLTSPVLLRILHTLFPNVQAVLDIGGSQVLEILFKIGFMADKEKGISLMEEVVAQAKNGAFRS